ncbi:MAG TPA: EAL domain-containing protein, partial [Sulfuricurvum sp.]|nr:EAL domain-containing protein [Sulfuricurvum sp.]
MKLKKNISNFTRYLWLTLAVFGVFAMTFGLYVRSEKEIAHAHALRLHSHFLAYELHQSTNDLTRMVHSYVVTGDIRYKHYYQEILDIREGKKPRPVEYHNVYWDLVLANGERPRPNSTQTIALLELMKQAGFTQKEFSKLAEAKSKADMITVTEIAAIKLIDSAHNQNESNRAKASKMLHDIEYQQAKAAIMKPMGEFHEMMDKRTLKAIDNAHKMATIVRMVFVLFGLLLLYMLWRTYRALYEILGGTVDELHLHIVGLGRGDFSSPIAAGKGKNNILSWLALTQTKLKRIDTKRKEAEARNLRLTRFYAALNQCNQDIARCVNEAELFPQICRDAVEYGEMQMAWISMVDRENNVLLPIASYGCGAEFLEKIDISIDENAPFLSCPAVRVFRENQPLWCQDVKHDVINKLWDEWSVEFEWRSYAALPLHRNGATIGTIMLYSTEVNAFDEAARNLLEEMVMDIDHALNSFEREARRKEAELALQRSEFNLNRAQSIAHIGSWTLDLLSNRLEWSAESYRIFGLPLQQAVVLDDFIYVIHPDDRERVLNAWNETLNGASYDIEHRIIAGGEIRWVRERAEIERDAAGKPVAGIGTVQDITERKHSQNELSKLWQAVEQSPSAIVITDLRGNIEYVNAAFTKATGYTSAEAIGKNPRMLHSGKTLSTTYKNMWGKLSRGENWKGEFINRHKDGTEYIEAIHVSPIRQADGNITHYMAIEEDISERKRAEEKIHYLANFDILTGLPNRIQLEERAKLAFSLVKRNQGNLAVMFIDLDHFKDINDTLGHSIGDLLLIELSKRLQSLLRDEDTLSRLGGDEFIALLPGTDSNGAEQVAQKLLDVISRPFIIEQHELAVTASIGISLYPEDGITLEILSKNADSAMYRAKDDGRDSYRFFIEEMQIRSQRHLLLNNALHHALERNELHVLYQPQVSMQEGHIIGVEALLRWNHPELGSISPAEFIPVAENSGLILPIGEMVLRTAVRQAKAWMNSGHPPIVMAVNLSAVQFRHPRLPDLVSDILNEEGLPPEYLELELTEGVAMHDPHMVITVMNNLHERGVRMSIDDFGTGYSSLSYLKKFKVYKLKIDQSFVRDISTDPE